MMNKLLHRFTALRKATARRRITALLTALILMVSGLSACGGSSQNIRLDVAGGVVNLDPQFSTDNLGCTILANTMEGLLRKNAKGELEPAAAESYRVTEGGRQYSFTLREGLLWSNGEPLTADDFVFSFRRIFNSQVPSPYAEQYLMIEGAAQALAGEIPPERIGVQATDDRTLTIKLTHPSGFFLERLSETAAIPCNQTFFDSTRARYGLGSGYLIYNGPFVVESWNNEKSVVLRPNARYRDPVSCAGVVFYTSRINGKADAAARQTAAMEQFAQGKSDVFLATAQEMETLEASAGASLENENRVWQLVLNTRATGLENEKLRKAMIMALDNGEFASRSPSIYHPAQSLIPQSARLENMSPPLLLQHNIQWAQDFSIQALSELGLQSGDLPLTLLVPEESGLDVLGAYLQRQWKDVLSVYVNMVQLPEQELQKRLEEGGFTLALYRDEATVQRPSGILEDFTEGNLRNYSGWRSEGFTRLLDEAALVDSTEKAAKLYEQAEQLVIDGAAVLPLLTQSSYFVFGPGVSGVEVISGYLDFRSAVRIA